jgi:hypothetical protein
MLSSVRVEGHEGWRPLNIEVFGKRFVIKGDLDRDEMLAY